MEAKKMKPGYRKKQITGVAKKVFATHGYYKTSIEMICKKAETSRGTIYRYFKNKEDIFTAILEDNLEEMNLLARLYDLVDRIFYRMRVALFWTSHNLYHLKHYKSSRLPLEVLKIYLRLLFYPLSKSYIMHYIAMPEGVSTL